VFGGIFLNAFEQAPSGWVIAIYAYLAVVILTFTFSKDEKLKASASASGLFAYAAFVAARHFDFTDYEKFAVVFCIGMAVLNVPKEARTA
jgi:hypothetical protein